MRKNPLDQNAKCNMYGLKMQANSRQCQCFLFLGYRVRRWWWWWWWWYLVLVKQATRNQTDFLLLYLRDSKDWDLCHLDTNIHTGNDTMRFFPPKEWKRQKSRCHAWENLVAFLFIYFCKKFLCFIRKMFRIYIWKKDYDYCLTKTRSKVKLKLMNKSQDRVYKTSFCLLLMKNHYTTCILSTWLY